MAKPITPTPILKDKEAEQFLKEIDMPNMKMVSKEEVIRTRKIFESVTKKEPLVEHAI
ncbi:MAG: hypothetical protein NT099_04275 [Candidatus Saganbacteria bacterium]|nr:hypothetical protein [Candidatus Saganbacteria bacterium]